jgi:hypothetical protein
MTRRVPELSLTDFTGGDASARRAFEQALMAGLQGLRLRDPEGPQRGGGPAGAGVCAGRGAVRPAGSGEAAAHVGPARLHAVRHRASEGQPPRRPEGVLAGRARAGEAANDPLFPPNVWPELPGFRETFTRLFDDLDETGRLLLRALARVSVCRRATSILWCGTAPRCCGCCTIRRCPATSRPARIRAAPHEDINFLTILVAAKGAGLELLDRDGTWLPVETEPKNLIVDSGDMLARMTNDVIPATTHRVVNPAGPNVSRYSMPFFLHPSLQTSLKVLDGCVGDGARYPEITAGEFLAERVKQIGLGG